MTHYFQLKWHSHFTPLLSLSKKKFTIVFFFTFRHNSYIQECTGHMEPTYHASIHDLRLLLQRFAFEKSFSEDTGGGGRDSNIKFVPYAIHMILYVLNT